MVIIALSGADIVSFRRVVIMADGFERCLIAVTAMLVCYALEDRSCWFILGFAVAYALGSVYGFLQDV
jgi:hypothetical protein